MKFRLPSAVGSSQDLVAVTGEIRDYARWFSHNAIRQQLHAGKSTDSPALSPTAAELIAELTAKKPLSSQDIDGLIAQLELFNRTATSVTITLAAPAAGELKRTLVAWCRDNIAPDILVNFQFNRTLLGGMVVRYGSHIFDLSFRCQILAAKDRFPEVLRHV